MKKNIAFVFILIFIAIAFASCNFANKDSDNIQNSFKAIIIEINENNILAEALEGEPIRNSADKISFNSENLEDIDAAVGDTISVTYEGGVMESYPAQVKAVSWSIYEKAMNIEN